MESLRRYAAVKPEASTAANTWFNLGDVDLATHLYRTARRAEGAGADVVAAEIARAFGVAERIVPMTNDSVNTRVRLAADCAAGAKGTWIGFQEYFVRHRHEVALDAVDFVGAETARTDAPGIIAAAGTIVIAPSNPLVSIGPIRALPGVDGALAARRDDVVAVSPIVGGKALKGPADRMLRELGAEPSVVGVARMYAPVCGTLVIDDADADLADEVRATGMRCVVTNTVMSDVAAAARLARTTLAAAGSARQDGA
jgi:LPPG:FO 2-phospho-L-lactate transferase